MSETPVEPTTEPDERRFSTAQIRLVGFIVVLAVVNVAYRLVYATGASHTAALYVGVPTLLAIGLALLPRRMSATGMILYFAPLQRFGMSEAADYLLDSIVVSQLR
jgi:hypothetical protein